MITTTATPTTRRFDIYTPGARTLADATPYLFHGQIVTATITGNVITIFTGDTIAHNGIVPAGVGHNIASVADYVITMLTDADAVRIHPAHNDDTIRITIRTGNHASTKNFGRKAAAAARRIANGRRIVRVWTGGANFPRTGEQINCYVYQIVND